MKAFKFVKYKAQSVRLSDDQGDIMSYLINFTNEVSPPHRHKNYEIIIYIKGESVFCTQEKNIPVCAGEIIIIPPDTLHSSFPDTKPERIYISGEFSHIFTLTDPVIISDNEKGEGLTLAKMIYDNRYANSDYIASLCDAFAHFLLQSLKTDEKINLVVKEIINEITECFYDPDINLSTFLKKSGYAEDYIRAQFKKFTGKTPNEFLTKIRIKHACFLIDMYKSSLSLSEIAEKCGYTDYVYFSRRFKQTMGLSPQHYKNSN